MTKCAVLLCKNYSHQTSNVPYHLFPTSPLRRREWIEAVRRERTWSPSKFHKICGKHFKPECYNINCKKKWKLCKDAIPTLHLPESSQRTNVHASKNRKTINNTTEHDTRMSITPQPVPPHNNSTMSDSPRKLQLKRKIQEKNNKIKRLQYQNQCLKNKVLSLQEILNHLVNKSLITDEDKILLEKIGGKSEHLINRIKRNVISGKVPRNQYKSEIHFNTRIVFIRKQSLNKNKQAHIEKTRA